MKVPKIVVNREVDDTWSGLCECQYSTKGWPTEKIASERIKQHRDEHQSYLDNPNDPTKWKLMEPLEDFRARFGLVPGPTTATAVFPESAKEVK